MITLVAKRRRLVSRNRMQLTLLVFALVTTILQFGLFHWNFAFEELQRRHDLRSFTHQLSQLPRERSVDPSTVSPDSHNEVSNETTVKTVPGNASISSNIEPTPLLAIAKRPVEATDPPRRFDILARQRGPNPKFPADFQGIGSVADILHNSTFDLSTLQPLNLTLKTEMLGLLIDAGRHFFPVPWLKRLLDVMNILQYNLLHLRLTDDQAFAIKLDSQPNLTCPTTVFGNENVYSREDIRELIQHARAKGISIVPEINVPGHSGAWMGIPGLVVPCKNLACITGYGLPLNASHPDLRRILTDVIREVIDIFENPAYLHLGGDEIELSKPCFDEVGQEFFNYNIFESMLKDILQEVRYPEERVIRWRETDFASEMFNIKTNIKREIRAGQINHWWHDTPGKTENVTAGTPIIGSARLYMDVNEMEAAWEVFLHSRKWWHLSDVFAQNAPINLKGLIVGTFELGTTFFHDRNVIGRMLAVTIGASDVVIRDGNQLNELYGQLCRQVKLPDDLCQRYGSPSLDWYDFKENWGQMWTHFKQDICLRFP